MDHVKASLVRHLARIEEARTWSSYGPIPDKSPTPGLFLKDGDIIGLPLSPQDALRIKRHAYRSSGSDRSDNLGCSLNPSQFELRSPAWRESIESVGLSATKPFDIGLVHLTLRALVLCGIGSRFATQQDLGKDSGVIGSMAFVLSSRHEGGDIKLKFGNETRTFPTAPTSEFNESFIAWFSDVQVNAEPITSGYRLQLVYDLQQSRGSPERRLMEKPSASHILKQKNEFRDLLGHWTTFSQKHDGFVPLVYILDDKLGSYRTLPLSCTSLKDSHRHKMIFLQQQCLEKDVHVYLAELTTSANYDFDDDEGCNTTMGLHNMIDTNGHFPIKQQVSIKKKNLMQKDWFEIKDFNDSDYSDYNSTLEPLDSLDEVDSCTEKNMRRFVDWAFVLLPESQRLKILAKNAYPEDLHDWIVRLSIGLESSDSVPTQGDMVLRPYKDLKDELDIVCTCAIDKMQSWRRYNIQLTSYLYHHKNPNFPQALEAVVRATMILGKSALVQEALTECPTKLSPGLWQDFGRYLGHDTLDNYKLGLNSTLCQIPTIYEKHLVLERIASGYHDALCEASKEGSSLDQWVRDRFAEALDTLDVVREQDGRALTYIGRKHGRDFFLHQIVPFAKKHASNLPFAAEFIMRVCEEGASDAMDPAKVCHALREVFSVMIPAFTTENDDFSAKRRKIARTPTTSAGDTDTDPWPLAGNRIAHLIGCCLAWDLEDEENYLLKKIAGEASSADHRTLNVIFMPFLQTLRQIMEQHNITFTRQDYQYLFQHIIDLFIIEYVKMEPRRPANQTCSKAGCGTGRKCQDCWDLDDFLRHPSHKCWDLRTTGQRRDHVERRVLGSQSPSFRCDTIKNPHAPHILRVTKTLDEAWEASHLAWLSRGNHARKMLAAIGHDALEQLLGDKYDRCVELRAVRQGERAGIAERLSPTAE